MTMDDVEASKDTKKSLCRWAIDGRLVSPFCFSCFGAGEGGEDKRRASHESFFEGPSLTSLCYSYLVTFVTFEKRRQLVDHG